RPTRHAASGTSLIGMEGIAVRTDRLSRRYGERLVVDAVDLTVERGEVYGFLGPHRPGPAVRAHPLSAPPDHDRPAVLVTGDRTTPTCRQPRGRRRRLLRRRRRAPLSDAAGPRPDPAGGDPR
ncbi:MAG TPA: hypothetical protein VK365_04870, partial [Nocardioidaceae bacterium]|nr:hypothetical protein [Nocardioidaceae bacterium]